MRQLTLALLSSVALLAAGPANAADMPTKAPPRPVAVPPAFSWSGCYIGGNVGWGWGDTNGTLLDPLFFGPGQIEVDGWLAGGQVVCNYQFAASPFVIGL